MPNPTSSDIRPSVHSTIGAGLLGAAVAFTYVSTCPLPAYTLFAETWSPSSLFGVILQQAITYLRASFSDPLHLKAMVRVSLVGPFIHDLNKQFQAVLMVYVHRSPLFYFFSLFVVC